MSGFSRRSLLGYSGSAAAGAALASSGTAHAATAVSVGVESAHAATAVSLGAESSAAAVEFPPGTEFSGSSGPSVEEEDAHYSLKIGFTVEICGVNGDTPPEENVVTPAATASALSEIAAAKGRPPITFSGRPAPAAIN
ncbi:hypothetical protein PV729_31180 [Streptomyces europaeiscabiei]|uniref:Secreted protein n=1 Tax=Streptomyces europaeiscabiei TaxID=146819 RepID=A0ABU4NMM5_9ACTN|nr:hypothetical protein [Streptomyces europaeiscabiei]MDX3546470.1 hypothetical protein [Streptomyces europaeiscabiei]MDX3556164.1 hypothetical protein [Streptomyces europaeiscabiei]MDX3703866.1 hypothetical protein [Streptomyces europaeiscabiei]